jgi:hypothetical protein
MDKSAETFKKDAHTVPANLGNRHHFTREECDTCNHKHGPLDEAVANFFASERMLMGVRKREGAPSIEGRDCTSARYDYGLGGARSRSTRVEAMPTYGWTSRNLRPSRSPHLNLGFRSTLMFKTFAPGAPRVVRLTEVATTLAAITVGESTLTWMSCDGSALEHLPGPLPPFEAETNFG